MSKEHLIPAAFIGRFSNDTTRKHRTRLVNICRKDGTILKNKPARTIGYEHHAYDIDPTISPKNGNKAIDKIWDQYETKLNPAIDALEAHSLTINDWINVLVLFVAGLFSRSNEFADRVTRRNDTLDQPLKDVANTVDNINLNRPLEMSQYATKLLSYKWSVYQANGHLIMPDLGYTIALKSQNSNDIEFWIPLDQKTMLVLSPEPRHVLARKKNGVWIPNINYIAPSVYYFRAADTNLELVKNSENFLVGEQKALEAINLPNSNMGLLIKDLDCYLHKSPFDSLAPRGLYEIVRDFFNGEILDFNVPLDPIGLLRSAIPDTTICNTNLETELANKYCTLTDDDITINV